MDELPPGGENIVDIKPRRIHFLTYLAVVVLFVLLACGAMLLVLQIFHDTGEENQSPVPLKTDNSAEDDLDTDESNFIRVLNTSGEELSKVLKSSLPQYQLSGGNDHNLPFRASPAAGDFVFDNEAHVRFRLPIGWNFTDMRVPMPRMSTTSRYILTNETGTCYIAAAAKINRGDYIQSIYSYGFRSLYEGQQMIQRYLDPLLLSASFNHDARFELDKRIWLPYMEGEVAAGAGFLLFAPEGMAVSRDCDEAFASMLRTHEPFYEKTDITSESVGSLGFLYENISPDALILQDGRPRLSLRLLFINEHSGDTKQVRTLYAEYQPEPLVYKDDLFYVSGEKGLTRQNIFSGNEEIIIPITEADTTINDFYIYGDRLFFMRGAWCRKYLGRCDLTLYESNLNGASEKMLASSITSRSILGFDEGENALYLEKMDGDAGCVWGAYEKLDITTGSTTLVQSINTCAEEEGYEPAMQYRENMLDQFKDQVVKVPQLYLQEGIFSPKQEVDANFGWYPPIRYIVPSSE